MIYCLQKIIYIYVYILFYVNGFVYECKVFMNFLVTLIDVILILVKIKYI